MLSYGNSFGSILLIKGEYKEWAINVEIPDKRIKNRSKHLLEYEKILVDQKG